MSSPLARLSSTLADAGLTAGGAVVSAVAGFALVAVVAQGLGAAAMGVLAVCMGVSMILLQIGKLGYDTALVHLIPRLDHYGTTSQLRSLLRHACLPVLGFGIVVTVLGWVLAPYLAAGLLRGYDHDEATGALRVMLLGQPVASLAAVLMAAARGLGHMLPLVALDQIAKPVLRLLGVAGVVLGGGDIWWVVAAWSLPQWLIFLGAAVNIVRLTRAAAPGGSSVSSRLRHDVRVFVRYRSVSSAVEVVGMNLGVLVVGAFAGAGAAGGYSVASRLVLAGLLTMQAVRLAIAPGISRSLADHDNEVTESLHQTSTSWIVLTAWPLYLLLIAYPGPVLSLFGAGFSDSAAVLVLLAAGSMVSVAAGNVQTVLLMGGLSRSYLFVAVASLVVNAGLALVLVGPLGATGVAVAAAFATVAENLAIVVVVRRRLAVRAFGQPVYRACFASLVWIGAPALTLSVVSAFDIGLMSAAATTGLLGFAALVWRWRAWFGFSVEASPAVAVHG